MWVENQISQQNFGLGSHLSPGGGQKCQNFKNFVFQARVFKISENVGHVGRKSDQSKKFGFVAPFES